MPAVFLALFHFLLSAPPYPAFAWLKVKVKLLSLWDPMDCSSPGSSVHGISRQEYWNGLPFPSPEDLPNSGIKSEPSGKSAWLSCTQP